MTSLESWDGVQDWVVLSADKEAIGYVHAAMERANGMVLIDYVAFAYTPRGKAQIGAFIKKEEAVAAIEKFVTKTT